MKRNRRKNMYLFLFIIVCSLGIGYAFLRTELSINGTADFLDARWDIHFNNVVINPDSVELSTGNTAATISASTTEVTYAVTLKEPGDFYEFTVDAVNSGSMDAMIDTISSKMGGVEITTLPAYMEYSVTYSDGVTLAPNQYLEAGTTETYKVHIGFKKDINASDLTGQVESKTFSFSVNYVQADENAVEVEHPLNGIIYTVNNPDLETYGWLYLYDEYPENGPLYYNTPTEALNAIATNSGRDLPFYLKHKVENGIITETYLEFVVTANDSGLVEGTYSLRGDKTENNSVSPYYESNKEILKNAFNYETKPSSCKEEGTDRFFCTYYDLIIETYADGVVIATLHRETVDTASCYAGGTSYCAWYNY